MDFLTFDHLWSPAFGPFFLLILSQVLSFSIGPILQLFGYIIDPFPTAFSGGLYILNQEPSRFIVAHDFCRPLPSRVEGPLYSCFLFKRQFEPVSFSENMFYSYRRFIRWTRLTFLVAIDVKSPKQRFMVPFERDSQFVGRADIICELDQILNSQRRVALAGIGGIG